MVDYNISCTSFFCSVIVVTLSISSSLYKNLTSHSLNPLLSLSLSKAILNDKGLEHLLLCTKKLKENKNV